MMTDYLRNIVDRLSHLPAPVQDQFVAQIEMGLQQRERSMTSEAPMNREVIASTLDLAGALPTRR